MQNREKFYHDLRANAERGLELIKRKNADYAASNDPYKNFRASEAMGIKLEMGVLIRMADKMARIGNALQSGSVAVQDESVEDTLLDLMNYSNILLTYLQSQRLLKSFRLLDEIDQKLPRKEASNA